jgi:hypothetical protein
MFNIKIKESPYGRVNVKNIKPPKSALEFSALEQTW